MNGREGLMLDRVLLQTSALLQDGLIEDKLGAGREFVESPPRAHLLLLAGGNAVWSGLVRCVHH